MFLKLLHIMKSFELKCIIMILMDLKSVAYVNN